MPQLLYTSNGDPYYAPSPDDVVGNPLYPQPKQQQQNNDLEAYVKSLPLPVEAPPLPTHETYVPTAGQNAIKYAVEGTPAADVANFAGHNVEGIKEAGKLLVGLSDKGERFQTWPEKMLVSGLTAPGDVLQGKVVPGSENELERALDLSGLAGAGGFATVKPGQATLMTGMNKMAKNEPKITPVEGNPFSIPIRNSNAQVAHENLNNLSKPDHYYRGMTADEFENTLGVGKGIKSNQSHSVRNEGTSFADDVATAESYANYGRTDPRITGKPTYLVEIKGSEGLTKTKDGYLKASEEIPNDRITRIIKMEPNKDGSIKGILLSDTGKPGAALSALTKQMNELQTQLIAAKKAGKPIDDIQSQLRELKQQKEALAEPAPVATSINVPPDKLGFVHGVDVAMAKSPLKSGTAEQWLNELKKHGVGKDELEWSVGELPKGNLTKEQVLAHIAENKVQLQEHWKVDKRTTKYSGYQMPGGENYRELLLSLPSDLQKYNAYLDVLRDKYGKPGKGYDSYPMTNEERTKINDLLSKADKPQYTSSHWDEPNVLAHVRMNDRFIDDPNFIRNKPLTDDDFARIKEIDKLTREGKETDALRKEANDLWARVENSKNGVRNGAKTLHVEEIQSDFLQAHRKATDKIKEAVNKDFDSIADAMVKAGVIKKICD